VRRTRHAITALLGAVLSAALSAPPAAADEPAAEVRAMWVTRWDYRSEHDVRTLVSSCAALGINRLFFQVRGRADAFYRSSLEPWGEQLDGDPAKGGDPGFDPFATAIDEGHRRGVEIHAWANLLPGWKGDEPPRRRDHLVHTHPEWFLQDQQGRRPLLLEDAYTLLNPCLPEVRDHLVRVFGDIASRYAVDGIHIDYARFLVREPQRGEDVPFDPPTLKRFREQTGGAPADLPEAWDRFRAASMDILVRSVSEAIRAARPRAPISIAAFPDLRQARERLFQDAPLWVEKGWIDEVCPMVYDRKAEEFERRLAPWKAAIPAPKLLAGIGLFLLEEQREVERQIAIARAETPRGFALFAYASCYLSRSPLSGNDARSAELRARRRKAVQGAAPARAAAAGISGTPAPSAPRKGP
jgi:uncharacterized lipoprotein YddW (UPF0748 family)